MRGEVHTRNTAQAAFVELDLILNITLAWGTFSMVHVLLILCIPTQKVYADTAPIANRLRYMNKYTTVCVSACFYAYTHIDILLE